MFSMILSLLNIFNPMGYWRSKRVSEFVKEYIEYAPVAFK